MVKNCFKVFISRPTNFIYPTFIKEKFLRNKLITDLAKYKPQKKTNTYSI